MTDQPGTVRFRTRGIDPEPVIAPSTTAPVRERRGAKPAAFASVVVVAVNAVPFAARKFPSITARYAEWSASSIAAPWPSLQTGLLLPTALAAVALVLAVVILLCLLVNTRPPILAWGALTAALGLVMMLPTWRALDIVAERQWLLLGPALLCIVVMLAALNATRHSRSTTSSPGSFVKAVAAGALLGCAGLPLAASAAGEQLASGAGPTTSSGLSLGAAALEQQRRQDAPAVGRLAGRWVAQLASARIPGDPAYVDMLAAEYLDSHRQIASGRDVVLVRGDDISGKTSDAPTWLTLNNRGFRNASQVNAWCRQQGLGRGRCLPRTVKRR